MRDDDTTDIFGDELDEEAIQRNLHQHDSTEVHHWPKRLVELIDVVTNTLVQKHSLELSDARHQARDVTIAIAQCWGGMQVYLPFGRTLTNAIRNKEIWNDFTGNNIDDLVRSYRLTKVQIYNILAQQRALHVTKNQFSIPFEAPTADS